MPISNFDFPSVTLRQTYEGAVTPQNATLNVTCVGRQFRIHDGTEKLAIEYTPGTQASAVLPLSTGGVFDPDTTYQKLRIQDGVFSYTMIPSEDDASNSASGSTTTQNFVVSGGTVTFNVPITSGNGYQADSVLFGTEGGVQINDPVIFTYSGGTVKADVAAIVPSEAGGMLNKLVVPGGVLAGKTITAITFCKRQTVVLAYGEGFTINAATATLTINAAVTAPVPAVAEDYPGTLQSGDFYPIYREQTKDYVNKLESVSSVADIVNVLGPIYEGNPLALACYYALMGGSGSVVYFTGVSDETAVAYATAMDFLASYNMLYSIVPCTDNAAIISTCMSACVAVSDNEESKIRRALWYGINAPKEYVLYTGSATINTASNTVTFVDDVFALIYLKDGDILKQSNGLLLDIKGKTPTSGTTIGYNAPGTGSQTSTGIESGTFTVSVVRTAPTHGEILDDLIAQRKARSSSERGQCVWADDLRHDGVVIGNFAAAAAAAGMRASQPCHRPLSNLGYDFMDVADTHGFTKSELKRLGSEGIWIIAKNDDGLAINMRQITTAVSNDLNRDEESIIANADTVAMALIQIGQNMVGCSNISPALLAVLDSQIHMVMDQYLSNSTGNAFIGPQLLAWSLDSIYQDTVNLDRVYANISMTPPRPFNHFSMTLRVL